MGSLADRSALTALVSGGAAKGGASCYVTKVGSGHISDEPE